MDSVDRNERDEKLAEDNGKQGLPVDPTVSQAPTCIYYWSYRLAPSGMDSLPTVSKSLVAWRQSIGTPSQLSLLGARILLTFGVPAFLLTTRI
jgi:hypothetical protein